MSEFTVLSLTTDYGLDDGFVAQCHGVAIERAPLARLVDVSHAIPPGDVRRGAAVLAQTVPSLPAGVHVAVVDPGVGTTRRPVAVDTGAGVLVGPDNGLLGWAAEALGGARRAVALTNAELHRHPTSHTFHGRDIFVPVAAAVFTGTVWDELGDPMRVADLVCLPEPRVRADEDGFAAEVLSVDRFGNVQLALRGDALENYGEKFHIGRHLATRGDMFAAADPGALVLLIDSAGQATIAVNGGSAAQALRLDAGDVVEVSAAE
ncbi:MAG TPA: SAM-dependent chlorinase/fluorinase [Stackebrandtia sp.]|jgi:S-adenosylmethionine hydrolase|uniref:SAM hydrolase/SAM-dependent halogenase family protein n=1 Tax=Stackebrandtia sp. TaxID=2023065 RepID=UPI002D533CF2|nr:SAM-dependent chlorinase/fluorinase [Stackebrandtia sp.]HZE41905.1 SAM-dependent chlorinase/fluorinase [Stackebrandtia sp.]